MVRDDDRGQAYTLESLVAAILLLTAVLLALQSVVITPTSSGVVDRDIQAQQGQQATDALATAAEEGELSNMARFWDCSGGFAQGSEAGTWVAGQGYTNNTAPVGHLDEVLNHTFRSGTRYNLQLIYQNGSDVETTRIVQRGSPGPEVVSTSYTVTLLDEQRVTGTDVGRETLDDCSDPAIPEQHSGSPVWNVVEVRLTLW